MRCNMKSKNLRECKQQFIDLYNYGFSLREIGEMYGVSKASVKKYIVEEIPLRQRGFTDKQKAKIVELYKRGLSVNAVANSLGLHYSNVKYFLSKEFGVVTSGGAKKYEHLANTLRKEYKEGLSANELAIKYGMSRQTVLNYIVEYGDDIRTYSETSRLYELNEDYFDSINKDNAFILGIMFAIGRLNSAVNNYFIDFKVVSERKEVLDAIIKEIYVDGKHTNFNKIDNTLNLRVSSKKMYDRLMDLGISHKESEDKISLNSEIYPYRKEFFDGMFYANFNATSRYVNISVYKEHLDMLIDYMNEIGVLCKNKANSLQIERKDEVIKFINKHNIIGTMLKEKVEELEKEGKEHRWVSVLPFLK